MPWFVLQASGTDQYLGQTADGHKHLATALVGLQDASPWLGMDQAASEGKRAAGVIRADYVPREIEFYVVTNAIGKRETRVRLVDEE